MRIVFMGTPEYAVTILQNLVRNKFEICAVFTQPDKPVGRKQILTPSPVKSWSKLNLPNVPVFEPVSLKNDAISDQIRALSPDFIVVGAYGKILPKAILDIAPCINLHASILPKFRGASPIQSAILSRERFSGVCAMKMNEGLDCGEILGFSVCEISSFNADELFEKFGEMAGEICVKTLENYSQILPLLQRGADKSHCYKITKERGLIDFCDDVDEICAKFKAFSSWPGIYLENGIKFSEIFKFSDVQKSFGEITFIGDDFFALGFKNGQIGVKSIQIPGKKAVSARDFINGKRLKIGDRIS